MQVDIQAPVYCNDGTHVGKVDRVVIDPDAQRVTHIVIHKGTFLSRDIVVPRLTGMTPFTSTSLDQILRNLGIKTVIATGVSINLGVFGMAMTALDLGYQVVVVRDAVAGVPPEFAQALLDQSISLIATVVTSDDLLAVLA